MASCERDCFDIVMYLLPAQPGTLALAQFVGQPVLSINHIVAANL